MKTLISMRKIKEFSDKDKTQYNSKFSKAVLEEAGNQIEKVVDELDRKYPSFQSKVVKYSTKFFNWWVFKAVPAIVSWPKTSKK